MDAPTHALMLCLAAGLFGLACGAQTDDAASAVGGHAGHGAGGASTGAGEGASAGGAGGAGATGGGGGTACGDAVIQPPETCDGDELGGKTCADFGLNPGVLQCNGTCQIVVSGCGAPENCTNGLDDDGDGDVDCFDDTCAALAACIDSCSAPLAVVLPAFDIKSTVGRPAVHAPSCATSSGSELVYRITPTFTGKLGISVSQWGGDFSVSVTTACGDPATEIGCASATASHQFDESLAVDVAAGATYFVMVDAFSATDSGDFNLQMVPITEGEASCTDLWDDDLDGLVDCDDPDCQTTPACTTGTVLLGQACSQTQVCAASNDDPICLPPSLGFADGYCSERCDLATDDCPGDASCFDYGIGDHGVCLDGCTDGSDCRSGYSCLDLGLASKVCYISPESSCDNYADDDFDGLTDCDDPNCKATATCVPGNGDYSAGCTANSQCASVNGSDPLCLVSPPFFFANGYCSEFCNVAASDCGQNGLCVDWFFLDGTSGQCFKRCATSADCENGSCRDYGFGKHCNL